MAQSLTLINQHRCFGGMVADYRHDSESCQSTMNFSVYLPPQADSAPVPVLYYLSGLTCTPENFTVKAGAQRYAAEVGLMLVAPDTSPRNTGIPGEEDAWDLGSGAGFYVDATVAPWSQHYRMYRYVTQELPALIGQHFPLRANRQGIFGHSMGGHGALICALKNPGQYQSVSAIAPIAAPMQCAWGQKAMTTYLGRDRQLWRSYDACELVQHTQLSTTILIDQGTADPFWDQQQLRPDLFEQACHAAGQSLQLRYQAGYDHSYFAIASFMADHIRHHAAILIDS